MARPRRILSRRGLPSVRELRVVVRKLPVIQLRGERNRTAHVFRDPDPEMTDICRSGRNEADVQNAARLKCIALVDRIAVSVELIRAVEMRAGLHWSAAFVGHLAAPENDPPVGVARLELEPDVERVDGPSGKEVSDLTRPYDDVDADRRAGLDARRRLVDRRRELPDFADHDRPLRLGLLAHGEA